MWMMEMKRRGVYNRERSPLQGGSEDRERNTVAIRTGLVSNYKRMIYENQSPWIVPMTIFFE